jgi:hypothetical protein
MGTWEAVCVSKLVKGRGGAPSRHTSYKTGHPAPRRKLTPSPSPIIVPVRGMCTPPGDAKMARSQTKNPRQQATVLFSSHHPPECPWQGRRDHSGMAARRCRLECGRLDESGIIAIEFAFKTRMHQHEEGNPVMGPMPRSRPCQSHRWAYRATSSTLRPCVAH